MIERRKYVRLSESVKIGYKILNTSYVQGSAISKDISGGGIRFPSQHRLEVSSIVDLKIYLPKINDPITATGEVVWWQERNDTKFPFEIGIKFMEIDPFDRGKIINYIRNTIQEKNTTQIQWID